MKTSFFKPAKKNPGQGFSVRERGLLAAFIWALAIIGAAVLWKQFRATELVAHDLKIQAETQDVVLAEKPGIDAEFAVHVERMQNSATLEGATLQGLVDALARQCNIIPSSVVPKTEGKGGVQILSARLTFNEAPMERLLAFEDRLRAQKIPLYINRVQIDTGRNDTLRVTYDIATHQLRETEKHR